MAEEESLSAATKRALKRYAKSLALSLMDRK
jgi:hypothetical protein